MAVSIDGFIASKDGGVDWLDTETDIGKEFSFETFLQSVDTIFMGRKSYDQLLTFGPWPHQNHKTFVCSKENLLPKTPNTFAVSDDIPEFVRKLKQEGGKNLWLFGEGALNHFFLEHDLIDEMMLFVQPTVLGDGIGIFGNRAVHPKTFKRKSARELGGGFTLLWFQK